MSALRAIMQSMGYVTAADIPKLVNEFPKMLLIIKWSRRPRERLAAERVASRIAEVEAEDESERCREVFIESETLGKLRELLQPEHANQSELDFGNQFFLIRERSEGKIKEGSS